MKRQERIRAEAIKKQDERQEEQRKTKAKRQSKKAKKAALRRNKNSKQSNLSLEALRTGAATGITSSAAQDKGKGKEIEVEEESVVEPHVEADGPEGRLVKKTVVVLKKKERPDEIDKDEPQVTEWVTAGQETESTFANKRKREDDEDLKKPFEFGFLNKEQNKGLGKLAYQLAKIVVDKNLELAEKNKADDKGEENVGATVEDGQGQLSTAKSNNDDDDDDLQPGDIVIIDESQTEDGKSSATLVKQLDGNSGVV